MRGGGHWARSVSIYVCVWMCMCMCMCVFVGLFTRPCRGPAQSVDVMLWLACCGTWPPLRTVSSTLWGSAIPQPPVHNTYHSIPQTTTELNTTTPSTISTQSFARRKTLEPKLIKPSSLSSPPRQQAKSNEGKTHTSVTTAPRFAVPLKWWHLRRKSEIKRNKDGQWCSYSLWPRAHKHSA